MGDGALELTVEDARDYLYVPDARKFDKVNRKAIRAAFQPLLQRPIGSVLDEIQTSRPPGARPCRVIRHWPESR